MAVYTDISESELGAFLTRETVAAGTAPSATTAAIAQETEPLPNGSPVTSSIA